MGKSKWWKYLSNPDALKSAAVIIIVAAIMVCASDVCVHAAGSYYGKYQGLVTNVNDPLGLGRLTAVVPDVYGPVDSGWAMPSVPFAHDNGSGLIWLPAVGDAIWIEFEQGDSNYPIWSGSFWQTPGVVTDPGIRRLTTPAGHQIILDDNGRTLRIVHPGGAEITITDTDIKLIKGQTSLAVGSEGVIIK